MSPPKDIEEDLLEAIQRQAQKKSKQLGMSYDEALSTCYLGFINTTNRFDPDRGVPFLAFMRITIERTFVDEYRKETHRGKVITLDYSDPLEMHISHNAHIEETIDIRSGIQRILKVKRKKGEIMRDLLSGRDGMDHGVSQSRISMIRKEMRGILKV